MYAGYQADDLAALLKYRLISAIEFLMVQQAMPATVRQLRSGYGAAPITPDTLESGMTIAVDAADGLDDLGAGFMDM